MIPYPLQDADEPFLRDDRGAARQRRNCEKQVLERRKIVRNSKQSDVKVSRKRWFFRATDEKRPTATERSLKPDMRPSTPVIQDNLTLIDTGDKIVTIGSRKTDITVASRRNNRLVPFIPNTKHEPRHLAQTMGFEPLGGSLAHQSLREGSLAVDDTWGRLLSIFVLALVVVVFNAMTGKLIDFIKQNTGLK
ncbi:LAME_0D10792g1_1 [Lachancea meyersii CBS 8951]|uniref:LAME_0D10792g1_1 n=1 Tax=Lachancea meyersii CBS 8951 TaxID=1266667 RepID=A0A1G4JBW5_9SACH|nr:LAME_0D10792g1_1 [Lachancea meyersii CBS 8951]